MSQESGMGDYESEVDENELDLDGKPEVSNEKLKNLVKRQKVYGDITQNASPEELETLLRYHENKVPEVSIFQSMTCDVRLELAEVQCVVASCDVRAEPILVVTCDVRACGAF